MESTYNELFSESDMLFNLSPSLPIMSSWREWIILHFTQIIDTETFQITFRKRQPCFAVLNIILNAVAKETRDTTLHLALKKIPLKP